MNPPFNRKYVAALLLALACVLALAGAGWRSIAQLREDVALTQHTREVQNQIDLVHLALVDVEEHHRAFLLTQDAADFEPYLLALRRLNTEMEALAVLTTQHAEQGPDLVRLQALVQRQRDALTRALEDQRASAGPTVAASVRNGAAKELMVQIRDVLARMDHEESRALAAHRVAADRQLRMNMLLGAAVIAVTTVMLASIYLLMRRELAARDRAERAEAEHRGLLERDIALRSRELAQTNDALVLSEARLRGIFDSATDAILTVDQSQTIVLANPAAARMLRCPQPQLVGAALEQFVPPAVRAHHREHIKTFGAMPAAARAMSPQREVSGQRADGGQFPIEAAISHLHVGGQELYTVILRDITDRKRTEDELQRVQRELSRSHTDLQRLMAAQGRVQEQERKRIARELHDELQQKLAAILMNLSAAKSQLHHDPDNATAALDAADELAAAVIDSTRRIVNDLRPQVLDDLGLVAALQVLASSVSRASGMACHVNAEPAAARRTALSPDVQTCLYRVAQESLNNVIKHARASEVRIELARAQTKGIVLRVHDNGNGMSPESRSKPDSFGLLGMQERLRLVGGSLTLHSQDGSGTTVEARVPMKRKEVAA